MLWTDEDEFAPFSSPSLSETFNFMKSWIDFLALTGDALISSSKQ